MVDQKVQDAFTSISNYIADLEKKLVEKQKEMDDKLANLQQIQQEKNTAAERLRKMEQEMAELSSVYEDLKDRKDVEINLQEVMKLYVILTEQVLDGSSHIKLLTLLHGNKEYMTKDELSKASGIQPAATLRAIFELRNNGLVTYEEVGEKVKLIRRLFD
jgi:transcription initiation factor IIE alpha subunit